MVKVFGKIIIMVAILFVMMLGAQVVAPYTERNSWAGLVVFLSFVVWLLVTAYIVAPDVPMAGGNVTVVKQTVAQPQMSLVPQTYHTHTEETQIFIGGFTEEELFSALNNQAQVFSFSMVEMNRQALEAQARAYEAGLAAQQQAHEAEIGRMERLFMGYSAKQQETINKLFRVLSPDEQKSLAWQFNHGAKLDLQVAEVVEGKYYELPLEDGLVMTAKLKQGDKVISGLTPDQVKFWMALETGEPPALPSPSKN